jgi:ubiquinone/menaquinone biosynthesis C-methylase UbiE
VQGSVGSAPFKAGSFSEVYFERVEYQAFTGNQIGALAEAARVLRPGGLLIIETGSIAPVAEIVAELNRLGFFQPYVNSSGILEI